MKMIWNMENMKRRQCSKMSKIGRNDPCPCGSGKKYKKCCLNKEKTITSNQQVPLVNQLYSNPLFSEHLQYVYTKKVKNETINNKLLNIYNYGRRMSSKEIMDNYLDVMNSLLDYAKENNIRTVEDLDKSEQISEFCSNVINDANDVAYSLTKEEYDLEKVINYIDRLLCTLDLNDSTYEFQIRTKAKVLFTLNKIRKAEKVLTDELKKNPKGTYYYIELIDDFNDIGDKNKAKYYYDLALSYDGIKDRFVIEERKDYFN